MILSDPGYVNILSDWLLVTLGVVFIWISWGMKKHWTSRESTEALRHRVLKLETITVTKEDLHRLELIITRIASQHEATNQTLKRIESRLTPEYDA